LITIDLRQSFCCLWNLCFYTDTKPGVGAARSLCDANVFQVKRHQRVEPLPHACHSSRLAREDGVAAMLEIDGSCGEGGGQLLRTAVALAAITRTAVHITRVRAGRSKPGLAAQHLTAVRAVAALCNAQVEGLAIGSQTIVFAPGAIQGGDFSFDVATAGSAPLVLQALLPVMISSGQRVSVCIRGGTDVRAAPPLDYLVHVLFPLLRRLGAQVTLLDVRRGYYPRGGGLVRVAVEPAVLTPYHFAAQGAPRHVGGIAHVANLPAHIAERMRRAALQVLGEGSSAHIESQVLSKPEAMGTGGAIVLWAETDGTVLGAGRVAQRGVPAESLGGDAARELVADLRAGATLDLHAADQLLIYLALSGHGSYVTRTLTRHAQTAMWLIEQFLPVRFTTASRGDLVAVHVRKLS